MLNIDRILVPTDFSDSAARAYAHAALLTELHDAEINVLNVVEKDSGLFRDKPLLSESEFDEQLATTTESFEYDHLAPGKIVKAQEEADSNRDAILAYTEEHDIDLVVMGTHGRRGISRLLLGSTARSVVRLANCPVLTFRAEGKTKMDCDIKRILVPVDFSDSTEMALLYAKELALTYDAHINLLHVVSDVSPMLVYSYPVNTQFIDEAKKSSQQWLADLMTKYLDRDGADAEAVQGYPSSEIIAHAKKKKAI